MNNIVIHIRWSEWVVILNVGDFISVNKWLQKQ